MSAPYRSRPLTVEAVQFDGSSLAEVQALIAGCPGVTALLGAGGRLVVRDVTREDRIVHPGWWVSRTPEGHVTVHSGDAFERLFEAA